MTVHDEESEWNTLVISGASGSGKSSIVRKLLSEFPQIFEVSVSFTTRTPRETEENGKDYWFITREEFEAKISRGEFLEFATYAGNMYGTGYEELCKLRGEKILILEIEKKGVEQIKQKKDIRARYVYIFAPVHVLQTRISKRALITQDELNTRLRKAAEENAYGRSEAFDCLIENVCLNESVEAVLDFIRKEKGIQ